MHRLVANAAEQPDSALLVEEKGYKQLDDGEHRVRKIPVGLIIALSLAFSALVMGVPSLYMILSSPSRSPSRCDNPSIRREWRSLTTPERENYIRAVQCLQDRPSEVTGSGNLYDDFVYIHMHIGRYSHAAASFLPWHRAFLHVYESTLVSKCNLTIPLPYWNWELDHQSLENSSIWTADEYYSGFGGDGSHDSPEGFGEGRCVTDGPFANVTRLYWDGRESPHCLSRSFVHFETGEKGIMSGFWFSPETVGEVKRSENYTFFEREIENRMHNALHWGMKGDFSSMASANEPLFWLHHGQLDRLWWNWQRENPEVRRVEYQGVSFNTTEGRKKLGSMDDLLQFTGLWDDIPVQDVMDSTDGRLCYGYEN